MGYYSYNSAKNLTFGGDDAVYVGFPTVEGGVRGLIAKSSINDYELAILSGSKHKSGAWEFIKYLLSEEEQMPKQNPSGWWVSDFNLPIRVSAIEKLFEISKDELPMLSLDELSMTKEFILSVDHLYREDEDIFSILYEDASAYFSGAKTLDETIMIISDRVGTLLAERK